MRRFLKIYGFPNISSIYVIIYNPQSWVFSCLGSYIKYILRVVGKNLDSIDKAECQLFSFRSVQGINTYIVFDLLFNYLYYELFLLKHAITVNYLTG
jgi:hypothetical protein